MFLKILLILAILFQLVASTYAVRLIPKTRFNAIWILFILGFFLLSAERILQFFWVSGHDAPMEWTVWIGVIVSIALSISMLYAHKLVNHVDRMEQHRQSFSKYILTAVLRAEEKSRSHFARELHDGMGPLLSSAKMSLTAISRKGRSPEELRIIENTAYVIDEAIRSVREISNNMSPHLLMNFGLARGVQNFINKCASIHSEKFTFTTNIEGERFDEDVEVIFYRVICELINNSLKHAACSEITLSLRREEGALCLSYSDNGKGFNHLTVADFGMGLSNIHSRIHSLGGKLEIFAAKGCGMQAEARVEIPQNRPHAVVK
ncbi:MAG: sensor histidine kinase [Rikenellaceae bacterium]|nr:sensor histidine kinase [Rikenellaceae bacterium]